MPIKFEEWPNAKHLIFVNEYKDRRVIFFIEGNCNMEECFRFISKYPMETITAANERLIPITTDVFKHTVSMKVRGLNTSYEGQTIPDWVQHFTNEFGGRMRFIDAYTFHVMSHIWRTHTGELE